MNMCQDMQKKVLFQPLSAVAESFSLQFFNTGKNDLQETTYKPFFVFWRNYEMFRSDLIVDFRKQK